MSSCRPHATRAAVLLLPPCNEGHCFLAAAPPRPCSTRVTVLSPPPCNEDHCPLTAPEHRVPLSSLRQKCIEGRCHGPLTAPVQRGQLSSFRPPRWPAVATVHCPLAASSTLAALLPPPCSEELLRSSGAALVLLSCSSRAPLAPQRAACRAPLARHMSSFLASL